MTTWFNKTINQTPKCFAQTVSVRLMANMHFVPANHSTQFGFRRIPISSLKRNSNGHQCLFKDHLHPWHTHHSNNNPLIYFFKRSYLSSLNIPKNITFSPRVLRGNCKPHFSPTDSDSMRSRESSVGSFETPTDCL